jgi:Kelch motif
MKRTCSLLLLSCWVIVAPVGAQTNTWQVLSPTPSILWEPSSFTDCTRTVTLANPPGRAYTGSVIGDGRIYYFGGAHHSYPGNDMVIYDIATNRWVDDPQQPQCMHPVCPDPSGGPGPADYDNYPSLCTPPAGGQYDSSCLRGSCYAGSAIYKPALRCKGGSRDGLLCATDADCSAGSQFFPGTSGSGICRVGIPTPGVVCTDCRPYAEHTYQRQAYNPLRHKELFGMLSGTWEYDYATRAFTWLGVPPPTGNADTASRLQMWEPIGQRMLFFTVGGKQYGVYQFNYTTNAWSLVDSYLPLANAQAEPWAAWDAQVNQFVIAFVQSPNSRWFLYDPRLTGASAWREITSNVPSDMKTAYCPTGGNTFPCFTSGITFDATNQRTIVLGQDGDPSGGRVFVLWAYDAAANTWQKVTTSGGSGVIDPSGYPNNFHYDAGSASLYVIDRVGYWSFGPGGAAGAVRTMKITLNLGNPLPTNTPGNTPTPTPTCAGTVRRVGPGRTYSKPSQAAAAVQSNDCVYIDAGSYPNDPSRWPASASNVTIRGVDGMVKLTVTNGDLTTGMGPDGSKGIWVINGDNTTVENIEFSCATSRVSNPNCSGVLVGDGNDAGIRLQAAGLTIRNCIFHDNDDGILGGPNVSGTAGDVVIENSEFFRNGFGDGQTHNLYLSSHNRSLTFRYNYSHGAITGHNLKSRAATNYILHNRIMDETNGVTSCSDPGYCSASVEVELPCGGLNYVIGNVIEKGPYADAADMIKFAAELASPSCPQPPNPTQELYVINNTMVNDFGGTTYFVRGFGTAPLLWAKNNIFWGAGTTINWPAGGTLVQASNVTADPKLLSRVTYDYRLTAGSSAAINHGIDPGLDARGYDLAPTMHYVYDRSSITRPSAGALDVGAFEYVAGTTAFPTPTSTPVNTATPPPTWTATPSGPVYCSAGQLEAVYPIASSGDDGIVRKNGANYQSLGSPYQETTSYADYIDYVIRKNTGSGYRVDLVAWRWNTARRPDGSAWPAGSTVVGAMLRPYWAGAGSGPRQLVAEWNNWPAPLNATNTWILTSPGAGDPTFGAAFGKPTAAGRQTITLSNADTNVNLNGYTGIRLMVSDGTPPATNEDNTTPVTPWDAQSSGGDRSTQLVICYVPGSGGPVATPTLSVATPTPTLGSGGPQRPSAPHLL